jgi:S-adenosylmethionine:tRNA ribosyltransferase-isomerase
MHAEFVEISSEVWMRIQNSKHAGSHIWALGTTTSRSLESAACGLLIGSNEAGYSGFTKLLIQPGFDFKIVDRLLTNFHQPQSTLLALVAAFSSLDLVKSCYKWAIEREFCLFSYGDLTCWIKKIK